MVTPGTESAFLNWQVKCKPRNEATGAVEVEPSHQSKLDPDGYLSVPAATIGACRYPMTLDCERPGCTTPHKRRAPMC